VLRGRAGRGTAVLAEGLHMPTGAEGSDGPVSVYVRPHDLDVAREDAGDPSWPATVRRPTPMGDVERAEIRLGGGTILEVERTRERPLELGDPVYVNPKPLNVFRGNASSASTTPLL
jgi:hypothetical protein